MVVRVQTLCTSDPRMSLKYDVEPMCYVSSVGHIISFDLRLNTALLRFMSACGGWPQLSASGWRQARRHSYYAAQKLYKRYLIYYIPIYIDQSIATMNTVKVTKPAEFGRAPLNQSQRQNWHIWTEEEDYEAQEGNEETRCVIYSYSLPSIQVFTVCWKWYPFSRTSRVSLSLMIINLIDRCINREKDNQPFWQTIFIHTEKERYIRGSKEERQQRRSWRYRIYVSFTIVSSQINLTTGVESNIKL